MAELRWGILGTGNIAGQFAQGVAGSQRCSVVAVGSRRAESAADFARRFQIEAHYGSYEALLADRDVDAVYVSLPNAMHHAWTLKALEAGKHVLCEKPFAVTGAQAQEMFDAAQRRGLTLVEAFMYRSHPQTRAVLGHIAAGEIGRVKLVRTSFCFNINAWQRNVRFSVDLAGGGIMDVGCYCVDLARLVFAAEPEAVHVSAHLHESGVDDLASCTLVFPGGRLAQFVCGMTVHADNAALICGDGGYIHVPVPWKPPVTGAQYSIARMTPPKMEKGPAPPAGRQTFSVDAGKPLYALEADDFAATVLDGTPPTVSRESTLGTMRVLEALRRQAGLPF